MVNRGRVSQRSSLQERRDEQKIKRLIKFIQYNDSSVKIPIKTGLSEN